MARCSELSQLWPHLQKRPALGIRAHQPFPYFLPGSSSYRKAISAWLVWGIWLSLDFISFSPGRLYYTRKVTCYKKFSFLLSNRYPFITVTSKLVVEVHDFFNEIDTLKKKKKNVISSGFRCEGDSLTFSCSPARETTTQNGWGCVQIRLMYMQQKRLHHGISLSAGESSWSWDTFYNSVGSVEYWTYVTASAVENLICSEIL